MLNCHWSPFIIFKFASTMISSFPSLGILSSFDMAVVLEASLPTVQFQQYLQIGIDILHLAIAWKYLANFTMKRLLWETDIPYVLIYYRRSALQLIIHLPNTICVCVFKIPAFLTGTILSSKLKNLSDWNVLNVNPICKTSSSAWTTTCVSNRSFLLLVILSLQQTIYSLCLKLHVEP